MKKILIITTSTGEGHNQAANSLKESFLKEGYEVIVYDFLKDNSKFLNKILINGYEFSASNFPKVYGFLYKITNIKSSQSCFDLLFSKLHGKVSNFISSVNPDILITTHPFAVNLATFYKNRFKNIPILSIVTDFKAHYSYINKSIDAYIVGSNITKSDLFSNGIALEKIYVYGIPVKDEYYIKPININKDNDYFNILLMGGSMGSKKISKVLKKLVLNENKLNITVLCGTNKTLKDSLIKSFSKNYPNKKINILGFSHEVFNLMDNSDLLISKPGGLTITEAINKNLPVLVPFYIPGQEFDNIKVLNVLNSIIHVKNINNLNNVINEYISNPSKFSNIKNNLSRLSSYYSKNKIISLCENLIDKGPR